MLIQSRGREQFISERGLSKKTKKLDLGEALDDLFRWMNRPVTRAEWDEALSELEEAARLYPYKPPKPRTGRPKPDYLGDDRISASYRAAEDIFQHLQEFRRRNGISRIPPGLTQKIIDEVLSYRVGAHENLVVEYLRENRKYFRHLIEDGEE
jgi:hypothetical protein